MSNNIIAQSHLLNNADEPFVVATVVAYKSPQSAKPGSKAIIKPDGSITGWVGGGCVQPIVLREAMKALQTGKPRLLSISPDSSHDDWQGVESYRMACEGGGSLEIYLEPVIPKPELLIVGRSPVAQTLAELGRLLDFKVSVADPQANEELFPDVDLIMPDLSMARSHINDKSFVVVATMGNGDEEGLLAVIGTAPKYFGLVASEKKAKALFEYVRDKGVTSEQIALVKCPAGVELGSETMPEIALSVMAEITRVRRAGVREVEATPAPEQALAWDPICGMTVDTLNAKYTAVFEGKTFYFCSLRCQEAFEGSQENHPQITQITQK